MIQLDYTIYQFILIMKLFKSSVFGVVAFILFFSFNIVGAVEPKVGDINSVAKPITT